jgi:hypothetical protein
MRKLKDFECPMRKLKDFECMECGTRLTTEEAMRAVNGDDGCPGCGGVDIDIAVPGPMTELTLARARAYGKVE